MSARHFCFVTTFYPPFHFGGDAISTYRLVEALAAAGHRVDVVHSEDAYLLQGLAEPRRDAIRHHPNVRVFGLRSRARRLAPVVSHQTGGVGLYSSRLREVLEDRHPDVIHFHNVSLMGAPGVLALGDAVKLYTPHEYWLVCPTHVLFAFGREACTKKRCLRCTLAARRPPQLWRLTSWRRKLDHIDCFVMLSEWAMTRHRQEGIDRPMVCIPHAVMPPPRLSPADPYADPYFLFVGRLLRLKGVQDLLHTFRHYRRARLVIAGDGEDRGEFEQLAEGLDHVEFVGHVEGESLSRLYRNAVALLMPSLCYEVAPLVPREAFGHETPVIARDLGALPEVVEAPEIGRVYRTSEELVEQMNGLLDNPDLRRTRGRRAHRSASAWTPERQLEKYLGLVGELIAE